MRRALHIVLASSLSWACVDTGAQEPPPKQESTASGVSPLTLRLTGMTNGAKEAKYLKTFTITPKALQAKGGSGVTLGVTYALASQPIVKDMVGDAQPGEPPPLLLENYLALEMAAKGTYAAKPEANVDNLVDATVSGTWNYGYGRFAFKSAMTGAYTRTQGGDSHSRRLEVSQTVGTVLPQFRHSMVFARVAYARVDPTKDSVRAAAIAANTKDDYGRYELELFGIIPVNAGSVQKIELRHLQFREASAPGAVRAAGLDRTKLSSIFFLLPDNWFVGYSKGSVPLDRKSSQVLQIGWSTDKL